MIQRQSRISSLKRGVHTGSRRNASARSAMGHNPRLRAPTNILNLERRASGGLDSLERGFLLYPFRPNGIHERFNTHGLVDLTGVKNDTVLHHQIDVADGRDVSGGISFDQDDVRPFSRRDRAGVFERPRIFRAVPRGDAQCFGGRDSRLDV